MNKLFAKIIAIALALTVIFSFTACKEVENGSQIERIKITLSLENAEGETTTYEVEAKLYVNFAPETVKHVKELIKAGHYNNVDITNLTSSYFQFGDYNRGADGKLTAIDTNVKTIRGEFEKRGFTGNKLTISQGTLVLNHANEALYGASTKYDTAKSTLVVTLSATAPFSVKEYAVFGKIVSDDGNSEADKDSMEYLSSLDKILKVKDTIADANGRKVFYCVNDDTNLEESTDEKTLYNWEGEYFTYAEYDDEFHYFRGVLDADDISALTDAERESLILTEEEAKDLASKVSNSSNFMSIPTLTAKIVKIELVK